MKHLIWGCTQFLSGVLLICAAALSIEVSINAAAAGILFAVSCGMMVNAYIKHISPEINRENFENKD